MSFFFCKIREQEGGTSGREEVLRKGGRRVIMVQKCVHMEVNAKMIQEWERDKGEWWRG
jgi:hypothetical protein